MLIGQLSLLLLVIFVADAAITVWQRGDRRQALVVGGSIVFWAVAGSVQAILALWGIIHAPIITSLFYMGIVAAMGNELSQDLLRAARLSDDLRESRLVFLTVHEDADFARAALDAGGLGYVLKARLASDLLPAIRAALVGCRFISPTISLEENE